jgi:hypothetical protein
VKAALLVLAGGFSFFSRRNKSPMNRCIRLLPFFIGVLVLGACSQIRGYRIDGSAPLPEFEGKMVYMKDVSTDAPVDSARIINGKFAFADTTKIENPVIKILSIHASKMGLEYRLPVVIENGTIKASIADVVCTEGTMLNERMQDFLLAIDAYSAACTDKPVEQIQSGFSELLKRYIEMNNDNVIGTYIQTAYQSSL